MIASVTTRIKPVKAIEALAVRYAHCMGVFTNPTAKLAHKRLVARPISGGFGFMRDSIAWLDQMYVHYSTCKNVPRGTLLRFAGRMPARRPWPTGIYLLLSCLPTLEVTPGNRTLYAAARLSAFPAVGVGLGQSDVG